MMHTLKTKHLSKPIKITLLASLAVIIIGGGVGAYFFANRHNTSQPNSSSSQQSNSSKVNNEAPTAAQKQTGDQQKQSIITQDQQQQSTASTPLTVSYTATNQSGSTVYIRSLIANAITNSGSCTLTITSGSNTTIQTSDTQALADASTCKGFNVPSSALPTGTWHLHLVVTAGTRSGSADKDLVVN